MEIYEGKLNVNEILTRWYNEFKNRNCGAFINFVGIVRAENNISALSFDIYEPLLKNWLDNWQEKAAKIDAFIKFAHSRGDVSVHESSFVCAIISPKRKTALTLIDDFVEDFKANAPIWKYDVIDDKRIYAKDRSSAINGAGILK